MKEIHVTMDASLLESSFPAFTLYRTSLKESLNLFNQLLNGNFLNNPLPGEDRQYIPPVLISLAKYYGKE